ncbi:ATP-binding protein [Streptomyces sp. NPDC056987]|uniref:HAMP domain-containing sensor histidine kinase n=1 Tax=Streptomyces sp. NPDC056987 TaxID=3345988 RepID=UPI003641A02A
MTLPGDAVDRTGDSGSDGGDGQGDAGRDVRRGAGRGGRRHGGRDGLRRSPAGARPGPRPRSGPRPGPSRPRLTALRRFGATDGSWPLFSIKSKLVTLVVVSVLITTGLLIVASRTETELRFITVFSMIATLLITQFVAHGLTAPLDEMNTVAKGISHGDYTRRVRADRRDELGDLASTINRMADDLEAEDRHRKELIANVSHELRTPIAALRAVLENVVDGVSAADPETMLTALRQTERLGRLTETLLDLSRLDNGVVPLRARRFEVWPYLSGVLKESNLASSQRGSVAGSASGNHTRSDVHLHLDVSPPELTAHADAERLHQVVANLIDNAVKHSPPHGRVTVRARRGETPESLDLEVQDEGPGIPEPERHKVFERFNRGTVPSPHGPGSDGGTGLGLAIARWAVDLHGGRIGVAESARGCLIRVTLPGVPRAHV